MNLIFFIERVRGGIMNNDRIEELKRKIADLKQRISPHSAKPKMLIEIEELEEELEKEKAFEKGPA